MTLTRWAPRSQGRSHRQGASIVTGAVVIASLLVSAPASSQTGADDLELQALPTVQSYDPGADPEELSIVSIGTQVIFAAFNEATGTEVWSSDGQSAELIADVRPGTASSLPLSFRRVGNKALFEADDGTNGRELWVSDGTSAGTFMLPEFASGSASSSLDLIGELAAGYLFTVDDELWVTDGTSAGTTQVVAGPITGNGVIVGDEAWFIAPQGTEISIWKSDGTTAGTSRVVGDGPGEDMISTPEFPVAFDGGVIFAAEDSATGVEPWTSDGTPAGTSQLADLYTGAALGSMGPIPFTNGSSRPTQFITTGDLAFFEASVGDSSRPVLVRTDGTEAGTVPVSGPTSVTFDPRRPTVLDDRVVFVGTSDDGSEPWITSADGRSSTQISDIAPGAATSVEQSSLPIGLSFVPFGDLLLFAADDASSGLQLWATDGTEAGTFAISDVNAPSGFAVTASGSATLDGFEPIAFFAADGGEDVLNVWTVQAGGGLAPQILGPRYADDQVLRLYQATLGRAPDSSGLDFWVDRYQAGEQLESLAANFAGSAEFVSLYGANATDEELVELLYRNVLGRAGDAGGVAFWLSQLADGVARASVIASFAESPENIERTGTSTPITSSESKVLRLYRAALGRIPDAGGLSFWVTTFESGQALSHIAGQFQASPEFVDLYGADVNDETFIDLLYKNVLGRAGDDGGVAFWVGQLSNGVSRNDVLVSFSESPENLVRTNTRP